MNNDKNDPNWSLQGELKKRKTQEIDRQIEKRKTQTQSSPTVAPTGLTSPTEVKRSTTELKRSTQSGVAVPSQDVKRASTEVKRVTQSMSPVSPASVGSGTRSSIAEPTRVTPPTKAITQTMGAVGEALPQIKPKQRKFLVALLGLTVALLVIMSGVVMLGAAISPSTAAPAMVETAGTAFALQPTVAPLPAKSADDVYSYFTKQQGLTLSSITPYGVPNNIWHANREISFLVGKNKYYLLSYDDQNAKYMGLDITLHPSARAKGFQYFTASNVLLVTGINADDNATPDSTTWRALISHMTTLIMVPQMPYLSRPTETGAPATATVSTPIPTK